MPLRTNLSKILFYFKNWQHFVRLNVQEQNSDQEETCGHSTWQRLKGKQELNPEGN